MKRTGRGGSERPVPRGFGTSPKRHCLRLLGALAVAGPERCRTRRGIRSATDSGAAPREEGFWVAVLPFKYSGAQADLAALADGLSEDIVTGLSRFSYLKVIARSSTSRYVNQAIDVRAAGRELGARYMMERHNLTG